MMTNADKFKGIFGMYATELWAKPEKEFLEWLNDDVPDTNVGDTISRQAAIDALNKHRALFCDNSPEMFRCLPHDEKCRVDEIDNAVATIVNLPSAQRKGKWIRNNDSDHAWKCSVCGCGYTDYRLNYCYDCGAEMKGEEDERIKNS